MTSCRAHRSARTDAHRPRSQAFGGTGLSPHGHQRNLAVHDPTHVSPKHERRMLNLLESASSLRFEIGASASRSFERIGMSRSVVLRRSTGPHIGKRKLHRRHCDEELSIGLLCVVTSRSRLTRTPVRSA